MDRAGSPSVTVYIANHNYGRFIEQAIQSVLNQTYQDFELIIIDDGSSDNSREIIEKYAQHEKVITIFQKNKGLNVTNNIALRAARSRYIMRLDADDYLDDNALMVLAGVLDRNPEVGLVFPDYYVIDEDGTIIELVRRHDFEEVTMFDQPAHGACTMIRGGCLLELGGYDESIRSQDGYDLWIRFVQHYGIQNVNLPLFYYRQHPQSLTRNEEFILETRTRILRKQAQSNGQNLRALAIVPVRGTGMDPGSPALKLLGGRALIDWTLESAILARRLSGVVLTTPDQELLSYVSKKYGDRVLLVERDRKLALPNTYIEDTISHALRESTKYHPAPDALVVLYIECPFRTAEHIDSAIDIMELFDADTVIGVRQDLSLFYQHDGAGLKPLRKVQCLHLEREELYRQVGGLQVVRRDYFEKHHEVIGGKIGHVVLDHRAAIWIGSEWDWDLVEWQASKMACSPACRVRKSDEG